MPDYACPICWHEDCTCGSTLEQRTAAVRELAAREAVERLKAEREADNA